MKDNIFMLVRSVSVRSLTVLVCWRRILRQSGSVNNIFVFWREVGLGLREKIQLSYESSRTSSHT